MEYSPYLRTTTTTTTHDINTPRKQRYRYYSRQNSTTNILPSIQSYQYEEDSMKKLRKCLVTAVMSALGYRNKDSRTPTVGDAILDAFLCKLRRRYIELVKRDYELPNPLRCSLGANACSFFNHLPDIL